jgi:HlyD family secretion protein
MTKRLVRFALVVIVLGGILVWAFLPAAVPADFATVQKGTLQVTVEDEGRTRVRDRYVVSAPVPGSMERIELEPGDPVVASKTVVARFAPTDPALLDVRTRAELEARARAAESGVGTARAERERIQSELKFAQAELKRSRELVAGGAIAARDLEAAQQQVTTLERALESAEFSVRTAGYQLEVARASLTQTRAGSAKTIPLYSPVNGVVLRLLQQSARVLPTGEPMLEIGDLDDLEVVADFLSTAVVNVKVGQPVVIDQWGGDKPLRGRVRRVEPSGFTKVSALGVEEQRVNVRIDFEESREVKERIGDGFRVEARIIVWSKDNVLKVPTSSLFREGTQWAVYKVAGNTAELQIVEVGQRSGLEAEVLSGLAEGDQIVVYPSDAIRPGVKLARRDEGST